MRDEDEFLRVKGIGDKEEIFGTVEPIVEEKEDMIDFGLLENEKAAQHIDHNLEECIEGTATLEAYTQILKAAGWDGVSKQTAKAMAVGLRRIDRFIGTPSTLTVAIEDETGGDMKRIGNEQSGAATKEGLGARAVEMWKKFLEWAKKHFEQMKVRVKSFTEAASAKLKKKFDDVTEGMRSYNPNNRTGSIKITVPARTAALAYPGGKYEDMESVLKTHIWIKDVMVPYLKAQVQKIVSLKGTESKEDIESLLDKETPTPPVVPASCEWVAEKGLVFKDSEAVEITVRPLAQSRATLKAVEKTNSWLADNAMVLIEINGILLDMINKSYELNMSGGTGVYLAIQNQIRHVQVAGDATFNARVRLNEITGAVLDLMGFEMSPGKKQEEEVSNENYDYGLEDGGVKQAWERLIQFLKEMWSKAAAGWEKLTRSHEVLEAKIESAEEELKQRQKEAPKEEKAQAETYSREINVTSDLASTIFNGKELIQPDQYLPLGKYVSETLPDFFGPLVNKILSDYKAGNVEGLTSVTIDVPKFDGFLPNETKLLITEESMSLEESKEEGFNHPTLDIHACLGLMAKTKAQSNLGEKQRNSGSNMAALSTSMLGLTGLIIKDMGDDSKSELVKAALDIQKRMSPFIKGAKKVSDFYHTCMFNYITVTLL